MEIPEIEVEDLNKQLNDWVLIDVRRPEEFNGELGHIAGAKLITMGPQLTSHLQSGDRARKIVFICRSGARSGNTTAEAISLGYKTVFNLSGGMLAWNEADLPVERD